MPETQHFGEVIGSDSQLLEVECHQLYNAPTFGSFVRADCEQSDRGHYAVVTRVTTGPFDGHRVVQAHRMPPGELEQRKPHLPSLLRTTFQALPIGYGEGEVVVAGISPLPPRLHCYVSPAGTDEIRSVTAQQGWLRPLTRTADLPLEELLVAAIRNAAATWGDEAPLRLVMWGKFLARLLGRDYVTLETVLAGLAPLMGAAPPRAPRTRPTPAPAQHPRFEQPMPFYGSSNGNGARGPVSPDAARPSRGTASSGAHDPFAEDW